MTERKKHHGIVDESSSEQQFRNWTQSPLLCEKFGAIVTPSASGSYGRKAVRQNTGS